MNKKKETSKKEFKDKHDSIKTLPNDSGSDIMVKIKNM